MIGLLGHDEHHVTRGSSSQKEIIYTLEDMWYFIFVLFGSFLCGSVEGGDVKCEDAIKESFFTGDCTNKWKILKPIIRPTQPEVGYAWIKYKLDKDFTKESDAEKAIDPVPAVIGPDKMIYIVDDHHTLCALDYSGFEDVSIQVTILCDKRNLSETVFWQEMSDQNLAYLAAHPNNEPNELPKSLDYQDLPVTFDFTSKEKVFSNDPWRSLAGYSRKVQDAPAPAPSCDTSKGDSKYCERCMLRGCDDGYQNNGKGVSYFEFRWSYFMNDVTYYNPSYWPEEKDHKTFVEEYEQLYEEENIDKISPDDWLQLAGRVIELCRGGKTASYVLPKDLYPTSSQLPGYVDGYEKLSDDPNCDLPTCI